MLKTIMVLMTVAVMPLTWTGPAGAEDGIQIYKVSHPRIRPPGMAKPDDHEPQLIVELTGEAFEAVREEVEEAVALLGEERRWTDFGPDAAYISARISLNDVNYTLNSWYPLHYKKSTIAVSETRGLIFITTPQRKVQIEAENSRKYKKLVSIFEKLLPEKLD